MSSEFRKDLTALVNVHGKDAQTETPDYILANFLADMVLVFELAVKDREKWFGRD